SPRDRAHLQDEPAMADVWSDVLARAVPGAHTSASAVPHGLVGAARRSRRVSRRRRRRRRVRRQPQGDRVRDLDAVRQGALAPRHAAWRDGVLARSHRPRARLPLDGRARVRARPRRWRGALELRRRLADRVIAHRPPRRRLLRHVGRPACRARPAHPSHPLDARARGQDHVERVDRGRHVVRRRLRGPSLGAVAADGCDALDCTRERPHLRHARRCGRTRVRPLVDRRLAHRLLDPRSLSLARVHRVVCLLLTRGLGRKSLLRRVQRRVLRRVRRERARALGGRRRRTDLRRGRRRRRRRVRRQLRAPHRRRRRKERSRRPQLSPRTLRPSLWRRNALALSRLLESVRRRAHPLAEMRRAAAAAAAITLIWAPTASAARGATSEQLLRRGIAHALAQHWMKPADAARYRRDVNRASWDERRLPKLRARVIASQLLQLTNLWDSLTSPRALALFTQLELNLEYFETHRIPDTAVDVSDGEGVVYRWFPYKGLEFHPLASFSALANAASAHDVEKTQSLAYALVDRAIPRGPRLIWEYSFGFGAGRPPWASGMAEALAAQALARAGALLGDERLTAAAARAYAAVPHLLTETPAGPWIQLYGFDREIVLNAQLQTIVSLTEYGQMTGNGAATALAQRMS